MRTEEEEEEEKEKEEEKEEEEEKEKEEEETRWVWKLRSLGKIGSILMSLDTKQLRRYININIKKKQYTIKTSSIELIRPLGIKLKLNFIWFYL